MLALCISQRLSFGSPRLMEQFENDGRFLHVSTDSAVLDILHIGRYLHLLVIFGAVEDKAVLIAAFGFCSSMFF